MSLLTTFEARRFFEAAGASVKIGSSVKSNRQMKFYLFKFLKHTGSFVTTAWNHLIRFGKGLLLEKKVFLERIVVSCVGGQSSKGHEIGQPRVQKGISLTNRIEQLSHVIVEEPMGRHLASRMWGRRLQYISSADTRTYAGNCFCPFAKAETIHPPHPHLSSLARHTREDETVLSFSHHPRSKSSLALFFKSFNSFHTKFFLLAIWQNFFDSSC